MASPKLALPSRIQRSDSPRPSANSSLITEVFKPKFPLDPFTQLHTIREPWMLRLDNVVTATSQVRRDVVLVLGAPALRDITYKVPPIPAVTRPAICTIHLNAPLAIENNGAVRLVSILGCAERVSRLWRKDGGPGVVRAITETGAGLDPSLVPNNLFRIPESATAFPSPLSSTEGLKTSPSSSFVSSSRSSLSGSRPRKLSNLSSADLLQRPFDVILNFLPSQLHDKALLKQTILVTTITRPYLVAACPASSMQFSPKHTEVRPRSFLRRSSLYASTTYTFESRDSFQTSSGPIGTPASAPLAKSRLVHILPLSGDAYTAQEKLIHNIESFQLSFSQPASMNMGKQDAIERAIAYIVPVCALRELVRFSSPQTASTSERSSVFAEWTVADIVLSGVLDPLTNASEVPHSGPRAWIGSAVDFAFMPEIESRSDSSSSLGPPTPASSLLIRERQRDGSIHWKPMRLQDNHDADFRARLPMAQPPPVPPKVKSRPIPRLPTEAFPSPSSSSEDSALESEYVRRKPAITVDRKSVAMSEKVGKRMHWRFWNSRQRIVTQ
ncbi:hypothetical protein F5I97DRAFT_1927306 [Phlebopus sp. FC_14]|nr:hypothetical protein F5I97DRAFT_1927306 [Phlebopus sp. FC_14]